MQTKFRTIAALAVMSTAALSIAAQSGGGFEITEAVIAGGGGPISEGDVEINSTIGQSSPTGVTGWANFTVTSGFWNYDALAPTAASVSISGRVFTRSGAGLTNAVLYLQTQDGVLMVTRSGSFGYYMFEGVATSQTVLITVESKSFTFAPRTVNVADEVTNIDFIPEP